MNTRPGFARLLPLMALTGLAAGTLALLASARPVQAPAQPIPDLVAVPYDGGCSEVPPHQFADSSGRLWDLTELRGHEVKGMTIVGLGWFGAVLRGETFTACDFCNADLRSADLRGVHLFRCDFTGADLAGADLTGATFDHSNVWPAGFDPQEHGARLEE